MLTSILSMAGLSAIFASILGFADKKLKVIEDPKIEHISELLPNVNCGACGWPNCHALAEAIVKGEVEIDHCRVIGEEEREEVYKLMGQKGGVVYSKLALVHCAAHWEHKKKEVDYKGVYTCSSANIAFGGGMDCEYGCIGFGDCVKACPFGVLYMEEGLPKLREEKCTGCGKCAQACPRNIIKIQEKRYEELFYVACSSHDDMARVRQICKVGCIACGICEKLSPEFFFKVTNNLSEADYTKQTNDKVEELRKIASKCPTKVIKEL